MSATISMSEFTTRLGRNPRWLEQACIQAIRRYAVEHAEVMAVCPVAEIDDHVRMLNEALQARLDYIVWLTDSQVEP